ncbi:hypothetical protein Cgig2_011796 [Carnegiea gigantea]|uniref:Uncharacterized protein n=1 Tax=Carnegiea gigantea TaxID=171969 RepID=A0A9Q1GH08_9CARY|nr:hypothetical protein Cgig2_011796 [Carnegiea gigantea]
MFNRSRGHHRSGLLGRNNSIGLESSTQKREVNPAGMIYLLVRFGDKTKSKSLEVDFLIVDVPTAYNVIIGRPTLHELAHPGRDIVPMVNPILGFRGQEVNPTEMIRLSVRFGDKTKSKSLEVDFLIVDVPTGYNVIIGRPTLHKVKAVIAPCLLQLQLEADDGNIGKMRGDQRTTRECYLVSIKPLIEWTRERGTTEPPKIEKRAKVGPAVLVPETLVIHTLTSSEPPRPRPEVADEVEYLSLEEERPERTVQLGHDIAAAGRQSLVSLLQEYKDVFAFC